MNKNQRLAFIKSRFIARNGLPSPGLLPVSRAEINQTVEETVSSRRESMNYSLASGDEIEAGTSLCFDSIFSRESESDFLLNQKERRELSKVWQRKPALVVSSLVPVETFAPVEVEELPPIRDPEIEHYLDCVELFERTVLRSPLLLMA